jgi:hypothetical protein
MRPAILVIAAATALLTTSGCASRACTRVRDDRREFQQRRGAGDVPQLVVAIPTTTLDQALSLPLSRLAPIAVPLPDLDLPIPGLDVGLGKLEIGLRNVSIQPAPPGQLGLRVRFVLLARGAVITAIDLETVIAPQLTPGEATVRLTLRPQDLVRVRPSLPPAEKKKFAEFILSRLPDVARLIGRDQIEAFADKALAELVTRSFPAVRDNLLGDVGTLVDVEIDLPPVPVARIELRTSPTDLELWVATTLPAAGLASGPARAAGSDPRLVHVRMSGGAAAELANQGIARGQIPGRYDLAGEPNPNGEFTAAVDWAAGPRPLRIHAWKEQPVCAHVEFSGTPALRSAAGSLELSVPDARIEEVTGAVKARAAVWFSGLGRKTFSFSEAIAGATRFDLLGTDYDAVPVAARVVGSDVSVDLRLAAAPAPARPTTPRTPRR